MEEQFVQGKTFEDRSAFLSLFNTRKEQNAEEKGGVGVCLICEGPREDIVGDRGTVLVSKGSDARVFVKSLIVSAGKKPKEAKMMKDVFRREWEAMNKCSLMAPELFPHWIATNCNVPGEVKSDLFIAMPFLDRWKNLEVEIWGEQCWARQVSFQIYYLIGADHSYTLQKAEFAEQLIRKFCTEDLLKLLCKFRFGLVALHALQNWLLGGIQSTYFEGLKSVENFNKKIKLPSPDDAEQEERLLRPKTLSFDETMFVYGKIRDALKVMHTHGMVHRDVKPGNVMIRRAADGSIVGVKLIDFGAAYVPEHDDVTKTDTFLGNFFLQLPELEKTSQSFASKQRRDPRSDITFTVGIVFFCITGVFPFVLGAENPVKLFEKVLLDKDIFRGLRSDIEEILAKKSVANFFRTGFFANVDNRFQTFDHADFVLSEAGSNAASNPIRRAKILHSLVDKFLFAQSADSKMSICNEEIEIASQKGRFCVTIVDIEGGHVVRLKCRDGQETDTFIALTHALDSTLWSQLIALIF